ncbi:MAG: PDZ domain-containing protein [Prevotellaceae bacterium]|jgi:tricorn protease|nr:PDZ domain-containing protein [Prevotellaceae bacterium]
MKKRFLLLCMLVVSVLQVSGQKKEARLLRFPTVHGDKLVFSYAGDLYSASSKGGVAKKITTDKGYEMFARFSPNGQQIAFTAQYDGNTEVYRMPVEGGEPVRLTYTATLNRDDLSDRMGPNNTVFGWKDDNNIIYRSRSKSFNDFKGKLYTASVAGGLSEELPLPAGGFCSYSPDKSKLAYNRVFREFRTWKYYKGGMADDIWIYDFKTKQIENVTNNIYQDICPMWTGDYIYYISDRERIMNLFEYNTKTKETRKVTEFDKYDIKFPSLGDNSIVFENGGYIYSFDLKTHKTEKLTIYIEEDMTGGRSQLKDASRAARNLDLSNDGKRIVLSARGDIYTAPVSSGITRNITETSGVHERNTQWSPDNKWIAYISDETGEDEIFIRSHDGLQTPTQLTKNSDTYKYGLSWSPDSKKILWSDKLQRLRYIDVDTKKITEVEQTSDGELNNFAWSPDSKWIAYTMPRYNTTSVIVIYNTDSGKKEEVTDDWFDSYSPSFSDDGKYLTFISSRDFHPTYGSTEWNHIYSGMNKIYLVTLSKKTPSPFAYSNDEVTTEDKTDEAKKDAKDSKDSKNADKKSEEKKDDKSSVKPVEIDFDGIKGRSLALDIPAGNYSRPVCIGNSVYYSRYGGDSRGLQMFDLKSKKETELGNFSIVAVTGNFKKFLVGSNAGYAVIDVPKGKINVDRTIDLSEVKTVVNLREEWKQIYNECWRQMRDFFYDPGMHGVDWKTIREKYAPLVEYVNDRNDLNYIIGEMIGELSAGHAYIAGGDKYSPVRIKTGLLGAEISKDKSGYYRIDKILEGRNWADNLRSPLTEIGVDAKNGDFIIAINGKPTNKINDIYAALYNKAGKQVELTLNAVAAEAGSRKVLIKPVDSEASLYYFNWVQSNIDKVNKATNGEVGYIHIPDMGAEGLNEFVKYYYPQLNKKALIIDDRGNGGGNVSPMIVERLRRELALLTAPRNGRPGIKPDGAMVGPKILLVDSYSASDGDLFPYQFKYYKLGKVVGVRTWGGVVGIRGTLPIIDGGSLNRPEFAHLDAEGKQFVIEGYGVDPDVVVDNDPAKEYAGEDQQLNKAIELILQELKANPVNVPDKFPPYPDKSK